MEARERREGRSARPIETDEARFGLRRAQSSRADRPGCGASSGAAAIPILVALATGIALAVLLAFLQPRPVAVVTTLVLLRYAALVLFFRRAARLVRAEEAVAADPTRAELYFDLAQARLRAGRVHGAVRAFRQGIGLDPQLDLDRPAELAERLVVRAGMSPARRRIVVYLVTAALFDRMLEEVLDTSTDETLPEGAAQPALGSVLGGGGELRAPSVRDVAQGLRGSAREKFLEHCRGLVESLRVEIVGLEQLLVALDGESLSRSLSSSERERQRQMLRREIGRLSAHAGEIDSAIRHARGRGNGAGRGG